MQNETTRPSIAWCEKTEEIGKYFTLLAQKAISRMEFLNIIVCYKP